MSMEMNTEEELFHSVEDISREFHEVLAVCLGYEQTLAENGHPYLATIKRFHLLQHSIIRHAMFSPNEILAEIQEENLKYLLLPYYAAETYARVNNDRMQNLLQSQYYYNEYLKLQYHYELLTKEVGFLSFGLRIVELDLLEGHKGQPEVRVHQGRADRGL